MRRLWFSLAIVAGLIVGPALDIIVLPKTPFKVFRPAYVTWSRVGPALVPTLHAAAAIVSSEEAYGNDPTCTNTGVTSGNTLVLFLYTDATSTGNSATLTNESPDERIDTASTPSISIYTDVASASESKTWTPSTDSPNVGAHCLEISGLTATPFDDVSDDASGTSTTPLTANIVCSAACIVIAGAVIRSSGPLAIDQPSYTMTEEGDNWTNVNTNTAYKTEATGTYTVDWTNSGSAAWRAAGIALLESGGGGGGDTAPPSGLTLLGVGN